MTERQTDGRADLTGPYMEGGITSSSVSSGWSIILLDRVVPASDGIANSGPVKSYAPCRATGQLGLLIKRLEGRIYFVAVAVRVACSVDKPQLYSG